MSTKDEFDELIDNKKMKKSYRTNLNLSTGSKNIMLDIYSTFKCEFNSYDIEFTFFEGPENTITYNGQFVKDSKPLQMIVRNKDGN